MQQTEEFFSELKEWSRRKLVIIKKYVDGFSKIMGKSSSEIYYVDGFAGRGIYDDGQKGSPVLMAEESLDFQHSMMPFILKCINIEKDHNNFTNLSNETKNFANIVQNIEGSFEDNIDFVLKKINGKPAVFFIDDFGVKGTGWDSVEKVVGRKDSTDIWIRFDHKTVLRLLGFHDSDAKDAHGKLSTLLNLFGIKDVNYLRNRLDGPTPEQRMNNATNLYIECLEQAFNKFGKAGFAASYPIISITGQKKYNLVFACSHLKAATLASNIVYGNEEDFNREQVEYREKVTGQMSLFGEITEEQVRNEKVRILKQAILGLDKNIEWQRENLHYQLLIKDRTLFGKVGKTHLTQALKELMEKGQITSTGTPGGEHSFFTILE